MFNELKPYIGHHYAFKLDGLDMDAFFVGIDQIGDDYGMVFEKVRCAEQNITSNLFIHPVRLKCTLRSNILPLRRLCRNIFDKYNFVNNNFKIYISPLKEIYAEKSKAM